MTKKSTRIRQPRKLSPEHLARLKLSEKARAENPNKVGPDAPKAKEKNNVSES